MCPYGVQNTHYSSGFVSTFTNECYLPLGARISSIHTVPGMQILWNIYIHGSFQKFCTLCVSSLKMNLFYKINLQAFIVISIVLYHSGPTFGQVLYSCLDAFVVDASDYSCHLIRHLLSASEAFPTEWFLQFWEHVKVWWAQPTTLWLVPRKPLRGKRFRSIEEVSNEVTWVIRRIKNEGAQTGI
jgi:hypothetical protein